MRLLHTSDWHVGKTLRGRPRGDEHRAVLAEIAGIAEVEAVDLILVAGDLFESVAPVPEAEEIVYRALLDLAQRAPVLVVAGNHDHPRRLEAVTPLLSLGRVQVLSQACAPADGGVVTITLGGTPVQIALLPFVSKRGIVRADQVMAHQVHEHQQAYDERMRRVIGALCASFASDHVNVVCGHLFAAGGVMGGGERSAHTVLDYAVGSAAFPMTAQYVALGHLHRAQDIPGPTRIRYCGSPLQLDFGEDRDVKSVTVVDLEPGVPAGVREVPLTAGRRLRTLRGSLADLDALVGTTGDDHLRVIVAEARRAGLADEVRARFPDAVDVVVLAPTGDGPGPAHRPAAGASPHDLFASYLVHAGIDDPRLLPAFDALHDQVTS